MSSSAVAMLGIAGLAVGVLAIAAGIALLVVGSRRHDDSTSRAPLAFGVSALVIGTAIGVPSLLWLLMPLASP
jgi:hypothetical protein